MGYRRYSEPSPLRSGLLHAGLSLGVFASLAAAFGVGIHLTADPAAAGPRKTLALFGSPSSGEVAGTVPGDRFAGLDPAMFEDAASAPGEAGPVLAGETALAVPGAASGDVPDAQGGPDITVAAPVRLGGRVVPAGASAPDGASASGASASHRPVVLSMRAGAAGASRDPADVYARPFDNPEGRPVVALVIGGLGINATQTQLAIDTLPAEVTLSFAPDARRLDHWIKVARSDGHEVLIEVPMEAFDYGRLRMHPDTLLAGASPSGNLARLEQVLGRAGGYFGVINYQGAKLASDEAALKPVFDVLRRRGLAFIDDGSIHEAVFGQVAVTTGLRYARADGPIDTRQSPQDIAVELMELETSARRFGSAMGAGFAFPVTIEAAAIWIHTLDEKGLILAPVSALAGYPTLAPDADGQLRTGSAASPAVNSGG